MDVADRGVAHAARGEGLLRDVHDLDVLGEEHDLADAEDVLQEARLRWNAARAGDAAATDETAEAGPPPDIRNPRAYLVTIVSRLCLDQLKSARARREVYVGPWLPEPLVTTEPVDPSTISSAFLLLLERLAPAERAAFLLREVFEYEYDEIARILGKSEDACRQLASRARRHVQDARPRPPASREEHTRVLAAFALACQTGDLAALERLLAADVTAHSDGGGRVNAARNVLHGPDHVARFILGVRRFYTQSHFEIRPLELNGLPALAIFAEGRIYSTVAIEVVDGLVQSVHAVLNPEKLTHLA
jgi:RNA polymerase sigma-70 factor (ECF subfamily)